MNSVIKKSAILVIAFVFAVAAFSVVLSGPSGPFADRIVQLLERKNETNLILQIL